MKHSGHNSKKAGRIARAKARQEIWSKLSQAERQDIMARNKAEYDAMKKKSS